MVGAPVHTQKRKDGTEPMTDKLNAYGATLSPPIEVYTQPPQSPDFNINDLAFFRALSCAVQKRRRSTVDFDKDQLAADVDAAWHAYGDDKVQEMWEYHSYCLQATIDTNGGNLYESHRSEEQCKASARVAESKLRRAS